MNKNTLRFDNPSLENLYYQDQQEELLNFYTWVCWLGSIGSIGIFIYECFVPIGLDFGKYIFLFFPLFFFISQKFIKRFPQYLSYLLTFISLSLGAFMFMLLLNFAQQNFMFLAGATTTMIQYSLLLGPNFIVNIVVILISQFSVILTISIANNLFDSFQIMFVLALILVLKSMWSNEKMKRSLFLLKQQNFQLHQQLDNYFQLKLMKFNLLSINKQGKKLIADQSTFTIFLREYSIIETGSQTPIQQKSSARRINLEQYLFQIVEGNKILENTKIVSSKLKSSFKVSVRQIIEMGDINFILMLQDDRDFGKLAELKQIIRKQNTTQKQLIDCFDDLRNSFSMLNYVLQINAEKQSMISNLNILTKTQNLLFNTIYVYQNCFILNNQFDNFNQVSKFNGKQLLLYLIKFQDIIKSKYSVQITLHSEEFQFDTSFQLVLQLILNLILDRFDGREYFKIIIMIKQISEFGMGIIQFSIFLSHTNFLLKENVQQNSIILKKINEKILSKIGWNKEIIITQSSQCDCIQFKLLQSIVQFQSNFY